MVLVAAVVFFLLGLDRVAAGPSDVGTFVLGVVALVVAVGYAVSGIVVLRRRRR